MAGRGPAPKTPEQRRNFSKPQRGEWIELPPTNTKRPPAMPTPPRGGWSAGTKHAWRCWWSDPASLVWTPADRENIRALAYLHHDLERGKTSLEVAVRLRTRALGLSQDGKRDLRLRVVADEVEAKREERQPAQRFRVV